jgi:uncharacterized phosphosugar-binding protein
MLAEKYHQSILEHLEAACNKNKSVIEPLAREMAESIQEGHIIHLFGCGHSHMLTEELFYRAGGLVPLSPILETALMLHEGAIKSSTMEKMPGYAPAVLDNYSVKAGEFLLIISNSGINNVPVEMALAAKEKKMRLVVLSSSNYDSEPARHTSGQRLNDLADYLIDNTMPHGDALVEVPSHGITTGPGSTVIGSFLMNTLMINIVEVLAENMEDLPVLKSGNVTGGMEQNRALLEKYRSRIKHL